MRIRHRPAFRRLSRHFSGRQGRRTPV